MNIKSVTPEYSGGGIYLFLGELNNGNFFIADTDCYTVRILNIDPRIGEEVFQVDYQESHFVKDLDEPDNLLFFLQILKWTLDNFPKGNYTIAEIESHFEKVKKLYLDYMIKKSLTDI